MQRGARVSYATSMMKKGVLLSTTEHLLAALYACGVDNVYIDIDAIEVPILDGSSQPFVEMLERAGIRRLRRQRRYLKVLRPLEIADGDRRIGIYPAPAFRVHCLVDYAHPTIGRQEIELLVNRKLPEHAGARTHGRVSRRSRAPSRRGLDSRRVARERHRPHARRHLEWRAALPDEFVTKRLDLIGDLALIGRPLLALVVAHKAGHALHTQLVSRLLADPSLWTETTSDAPENDSLAAEYSAEQVSAAS